VAGGKSRNEEIRDWYSSPNIFAMTKPRKMILARHVESIGEKRNAYRVLV
jgi:hypothetical protein